MKAMAPSKLGENSKGHEAMEQKAMKGDLSELLEQVEEMYKAFLVESPSAESKDESKCKKPEPWRSRTLERRKQSSGLSSPSLTTSEHKKTDSPQEWQEATNLKESMQNIVHSKKYKKGDRLSAEDEMKVSSVFQYHPSAELKTGPGIDYFKIDQIYDEFTRCLWAVRVDGTAVSFSFHKCLQAKLARESPHLVEQYESTFTDFRTLDRLQESWRRGEKPPST